MALALVLNFKKKELLKAAKKTAIKYFYIEDESKGVKEQVPKSLAYLKRI